MGLYRIFVPDGLCRCIWNRRGTSGFGGKAVSHRYRKRVRDGDYYFRCMLVRCGSNDGENQEYSGFGSSERISYESYERKYLLENDKRSVEKRQIFHHKLYRRYRWLVITGAGLGMVISIGLFQPLSLQMQKLYGVSANGLNRYFYAVLSAVFAGGFIVFFVLRILRKLNEMTALGALTGRIDAGKKKGNMLCIMFVTVIAVFLILIPSNLYSTLSRRI